MNYLNNFTDEEKISILLTSYQYPKVLFQGQQGSGKSASLTLFTLLLANVLDLQIMSNMSMDYYNPIIESRGKPSFIPLTSKEQIDENRNFIFVLDEAQNSLDSRNFGKNEVINQLLVSLRKNGIIWHMSSQFLDQLDIRARRMINLIINCTKIYGQTPEEDIYQWDIYKNIGYEDWLTISTECYYDTIYIPHNQMQLAFSAYNTLEKPKKI